MKTAVSPRMKEVLLIVNAGDAAAPIVPVPWKRPTDKKVIINSAINRFGFIFLALPSVFTAVYILPLLLLYLLTALISISKVCNNVFFLTFERLSGTEEYNRLYDRIDRELPGIALKYGLSESAELEFEKMIA